MKKFSHGHVQERKPNIVIHGLGWFCIRGDMASVDVYMAQQGNVTFRKAMV